MADLTDVKRNDDESTTVRDDASLSVEPEQETAESTNVTHVPSRDWQIGCNLNECLLNVYNNDRWTDMAIRCGGNEDSRTLKAHKIILAARSPVFEAMLFGPCSDGKTEYDFPDADVDIFDMMLRFMYYDDANLTNVDDATDLMQLAHMYQVTFLVDHCAQYLLSNMADSNVCRSLESALKYDTPALRDACCEFVDGKVKEFMQTNEFLNVSKEGLIYMLKGDTFFADEDVIFHRVEEWAKLKLAELGKEDTGQNIRDVLADAFYHLRLTTMPAVKLMKCIKRKGYFSFDEHEDIMDCCLNSQSHPCFVSNVRRVPLEESLPVSCDSGVSTKGSNVEQVLQIIIDKDLHLAYIKIPLLRTCPKNYNQAVPISLNALLSVVVKIDEINFENHSKLRQLSNKSSKIMFDKSVLLKKRESPYELQIQIEPSCKDSSVFLEGTNGTIRASSSSNVFSVSQKKKSIIGISAIGIRNCSFRGNIGHSEQKKRKWVF